MSNETSRPRSIAILSPGDMGHGIGAALGRNGFDVVTCLSGRSPRTAALAEQGGFRIVPTLSELVNEVDAVLSILVPAQAEALAAEVAHAFEQSRITIPFVDCNAIAPHTTERIRATIVAAGARFIDGSIIGPPPGRGSPPRLYLSGADAKSLQVLASSEMAVKVISDRVGDASSIKMCYAALTKGTTTLHVALLAVARALGVQAELEAELAFSQDMTLQQMRQSIPSLPANAHRWIGEMEEIAATFASVGAPEGFHQGAAAIYRLLDGTAFASESPETIDSTRTLEETITATAGLLSVSYRDQGNG